MNLPITEMLEERISETYKWNSKICDLEDANIFIHSLKEQFKSIEGQQYDKIRQESKQEERQRIIGILEEMIEENKRYNQNDWVVWQIEWYEEAITRISDYQ